MFAGRRMMVILLLAALLAGVVIGVRNFLAGRQDQKETADFASFQQTWTFDPNDPNLLEARFLGADGATVSLGFAKTVTRGGIQFVTFEPTTATFLDLGAQQIHMASKPDASLSDIPSGSTVKLRVGQDGDNPGHYIIYDILVF